MNAKIASEGSAFGDFSHQSAAYLRHHQDFIWWELNPGPHPPPSQSGVTFIAECDPFLFAANHHLLDLLEGGLLSQVS